MDAKITQPSSYVKAIWSGAVAGLGALVTVMVGDVGFGDLTAGQWVSVASTVLIAGGGTFGLTNQPVKP
jgi:hypothetical protein